MAEKLVLQSESLDEEYKMLQKEMEDLDQMYDETNKRIQSLSAFPSRTSPVLLSSQTTNLITIKEKKINIIKELINIKKTKIDIRAKEFNYNNKLDEGNGGVNKEILEIYRLITNHANIDELEVAEEDDNLKNMSDAEIDKLLDARINEGNEVKKEETKKQQELPDGYKIVVTKDKEFFIIDNDYNIIDDIEYDTSVIDIVEFYEDDEEEFAKDSDGNIYEVVEL